jgi:hypothetical protein
MGFGSVAFLASLAAFGGCSNDDCAASGICAGAPGGGGAPRSADGDAADGSPVELTGPSFMFEPISPQPRVMHDSSLTVKLRIERGPSQNDDVVVTVTDLPDGVTVDPLTIKGTESTGELVVKVAGAAKQGPFEAVIEGTAAKEKARTKLPLFVRGKPGVVDTTFGTDGRKLSVLGAGASPPREMLVDAQDRIHVVSNCGNSTCVVRLTAEGVPDPTYGSGAVVSLSVPGPQAAVLDSVGRLVVGGGKPAPVVGRLLSGGQIDSSFGIADGGGGGVTASLQPTEAAYNPASAVVAVAVGTGDSIFAAFPANSRGGLRRLDASGKRDLSFGSNGFVPVIWGATEQPGGVYAYGDAVTVTGSWVLGIGDIGRGIGISQFSATSGEPNAAFGLTGSGMTRFEREVTTIAAIPGVLLRLPDGRWLSAYSEDSTKYLATINADGKAFSAGFGTAGRAGLAPAGTITRVARQADGKLLVAMARQSRDVLVRLGANGAPDATFGAGGVLELMPFAASLSRCVGVQSDGRIVLASADTTSQTTYVTRIWD